MKKYKIAAILMIIHGGFMELGGIFAMIPALLIGTDKYDIGQYFEFKLPYFQDNLYMMMVMGAIYGVFRLIGAIGLLKNRMWGLVLSVINCVITITLMMFLLPAGIMDGILAGSALILILMQYFGDKKIVEYTVKFQFHEEIEYRGNFEFEHEPCTGKTEGMRGSLLTRACITA